MRGSLQHHREREVNFGDRTKLTGKEQKTLASMSLDASGPFTVYATARVTAPASLAPFVVTVVTLEWGHGGASVRADYQLVRRLRVPLAASMIQLAGRLVDIRTGEPASESASADVAAFIARGTDGETLRNAFPVVQSGAGGALAVGAQQVLAVRGYNAGASTLWVMLFDGLAAPLVGDGPRLALPAPASPATFSCELTSPRAFLAGVWWAASAEPFTLAPAPGAALYVDVDFLP
jgi:hypothetical protein